MTTRMWEAVAADGHVDDLVAWATAHAPDVAQVYRSADNRVVIIDPSAAALPGPPEDLVSRAPHTWDFEPVDR
jgi:hypothetical protein